MNFCRISNLLLAGSVVALAGCASVAPAPVSDRTLPRAEKMSAAEVKPGYYQVKKGDTIYSIALSHGQDHKDIVLWNRLDNPNIIEVGQLLRVAPPENTTRADAAEASGDSGGVVEMGSVAPPVQIESRSVAVTGSVPATTAGNAALKREPKGGMQPYTDDAWAQIQNSPAAQGKTSEPTSPPASPPPAKAAEESIKPAAAVAASDVSWTWPTANKMSVPFGESDNKGLDFNGAVGDPVLAAASGKVTLVTNSLRGYGNLIVVKHNSSYLSVYAHNSKMLVKEGQTVGKGQKIAEIGSSDSDRPNLHFEIRREGKPVDPAKFLPPR